MIKIVWSIKDINKYQTGNLPDNAIKIETPKSVDELMKKLHRSPQFYVFYFLLLCLVKLSFAR